MGKGMVKAVAGTAIRNDHVIIVHQPDMQKVVVQCQACGEARTHELPSSIPALTRFLRKMDKEHRACAPSS